MARVPCVQQDACQKGAFRRTLHVAYLIVGVLYSIVGVLYSIVNVLYSIVKILRRWNSKDQQVGLWRVSKQQVPP